MDGFFRDWLQPDLEIGEIVTEIELSIPPPGHGWGFREAARRHGDFALAGAAIVIASERGMITYVRIGLLGAGIDPVPSQKTRRGAPRPAGGRRPPRDGDRGAGI